MFRKILIANRGEVALRVIGACRELDVRTVAVYSTPDATSPHVRLADESVCIGPAHASQSYLNLPALIGAAEITGADAVHPGYGFLAESATFAEAVGSLGATFIGPRVETLRLLGDKVRARDAMARAGLSVLPGTVNPPETLEAAVEDAALVGYPLMLKASGGGGGKGMRVARNERELRDAWAKARREAEATCGDGTLYLERWLDPARHLEVQVMGDRCGAMIHLGERECSVQRRHQKVLEEAPSPAPGARQAWWARVVEAARSVAYEGVGTFEFLIDASGDPFFLEVNPRLQVEHAVTEMVTGVDIVKEQIRVAAGEQLSIRQADIEFSGHAIECRIVAESPTTFRPSSGTILTFQLPSGPGIRVDTGVCVGTTVSPHYDSLLAKLVAWGRNRTEAVARMRRALAMTVIEGVDTSVTLHERILTDPDFVAGRVSIRFAERFVST